MIVDVFGIPYFFMFTFDEGQLCKGQRHVSQQRLGATRLTRARRKNIVAALESQPQTQNPPTPNPKPLNIYKFPSARLCSRVTLKKRCLCSQVIPISKPVFPSDPKQMVFVFPSDLYVFLTFDNPSMFLLLLCSKVIQFWCSRVI